MVSMGSIAIPPFLQSPVLVLALVTQYFGETDIFEVLFGISTKPHGDCCFILVLFGYDKNTIAIMILTKKNHGTFQKYQKEPQICPFHQYLGLVVLSGNIKLMAAGSWPPPRLHGILSL